MRTFLALCLLLWTVAPVASKDVVIKEDGGGIIEQYIGHYEVLARRGDRVVIDGWCASACTIALHYPKTCVTKRAMLGFHEAYYDVLGMHIISKANTALLASYYPPQIMKWINAHGGLKPGLLIMGPNTARLYLQSCGEMS